MFRYLKFVIQRRFRRLKRLWGRSRSSLVAYLERHIWGKWRQLGIIRRFVGAWWGLMLIALVGSFIQYRTLGDYYLVATPQAGGQYVEGEVGQVDLINPILPENSASSDISKLVFNGLTRITPSRQIEGDLATGWDVSPDGTTYTFHLRHGVKWQDGVPFTSRDVLFTLTAIQSPDTRSPLADSWKGITASAPDDYTVVYKLPAPYQPFIYYTTVGILPSHLLENTDPSQLRVQTFNQQPVGTGPFKVTSFVPASTGQEEVQLVANQDYFRGAPKLDRFIFRFYDNYPQLVAAFAKQQVTAISRWWPGQADASQLKDIDEKRMALPVEADVFLNMSQAPLDDKAVRTALTEATDRSQLISQALDGAGRPMTLPLLPGQLGYSTADQPPGYDPTAAAQTLDSDGWLLDKKTGTRMKDGKELRLKLVTSETETYPKVARLLSSQWSKIGVRLDVVTVPTGDLEQSYIKPRNYQLLLFGINLGADPDVYVYWHSSQKSDPGLNLSEYANHDADQALESGRITKDPAERAVKYQNFLKDWSGDVPAVVLYQPDYVYATRSSVMGVKALQLVDPSDRFYDVREWTVRQKLAPR